MNGQYSQTVDVEVSSHYKRLAICGLVFLLLTVAMIVVSAVASLFALIGVGVCAVVGAVCLYVYTTQAKQFEYDLNDARIVIAKKDMLGKTKRIANIMLDDISAFDIFGDMVAGDGGDIVACSKAYEAGVYVACFEGDGVKGRLIFKPDEYMLSLLAEALKRRGIYGSLS